LPGMGAGGIFLAGGAAGSPQPVETAANATTRIIPISFFMDHSFIRWTQTVIEVENVPDPLCQEIEPE